MNFGNCVRRLSVSQLLLLTLLLVGSGCVSESTQSELAHVGDAVDLPLPTGEVVLTIHGSETANVEDRVELDLGAIESVGTVTVFVDEPFVNETLRVTGVRVDHLLGAAGVDPEAELLWTALDGYTVGFSRAAAAAEDTILAIKIEGQSIPIEEGGPVRVMFPSAEGPLGRDTNQWIWSVHDISVK